ncbi:MAG: YcjX family protein [Pseudomonadota bacterium]
MGITDWADDLIDGANQALRGASEIFEPVLRLGVTGLSRSGKTVFITALVASLLNRGRMRLLNAEAQGRFLAAMLRPQPDPEVPRFAYEAHLAKLTAPDPEWPQSTRQVSQLRLSLKVQPSGFISGLTGARTLHLDIVDYPGEWLLDLPLLEKSYAEWSAEALEAATSPARAAQSTDYRTLYAATDPTAPLDEPKAEALAGAYRAYLTACREAGLSALAPGRFLLPGDLEGSPALTFAPLPVPDTRPGRGSLYREMESRFDAYKRVVVKPFFRNHFARLDRQVVLVDALGALAQGPRALGDLTHAMAETLSAFRHGQSDWLDRLLGGRRIEKLLFVASKADHLHQDQHDRLTGLVQAMLAEASRRASFAGAETSAMAIAAIRASSEQTIRRDGADLGVVRGRRAEDGREVALYPGALPDDFPGILAEAAASDPGAAAEGWVDAAFARPAFAPPRWGSGANDGPPHIRLDRALDFLIGDKLE